MPVYKITPDRIEPLPATSFAQRGIKERSDLQRLLRANIDVVAPDVLVIAEEFGEWDDSKRRIDLLGVDDKANLVVIELKRGDDGEHMELQAIRYAAMVSGMTFARAVQVYQGFLDRAAVGQNAKDKLLEHLNWEEPREDDFAQDVRIILVSGDFSKELTTAVLWLNQRDLDIRCVRIKPYANGPETIVDVQQVVPLPEAEEYMVQVREKEQAQRSEKAERHSERRAFWSAVLPEIQRLTGRWKNWNGSDSNWIGSPSGIRGLIFYLWVRQGDCGCQLNIDGGADSHGWNKAVYDALLAKQADIEGVFGRPLSWWRLDDKRSSGISEKTADVGYRSPRESWADVAKQLAESAKKFESALRPHLEAAVASAQSSA